MSKASSIQVVYRIETPRLILRCWDPADAPAMHEAIESSQEHLRPWVPWAEREIESIIVQSNRIREWRSNFDRSRDFFFGVFDQHDAKRVLGGIGFHARIGAGAKEIGYWIRADCAAKGLMTEAAGAMTRIGFEHDGLTRIEIQCDPKNLASAAIPRKLGYRHTLTIFNRVSGPKLGPRDTSIFVMSRNEFASSPAATMEVQAFDALGSEIDRTNQSATSMTSI